MLPGLPGGGRTDEGDGAVKTAAPLPAAKPCCDACKQPRTATLHPQKVKGKRVYLCGVCRNLYR